jgi:hypothetical protein
MQEINLPPTIPLLASEPTEQVSIMSSIAFDLTV